MGRDRDRDPRVSTFVTEETWEEWLERLYSLRRDKRGPHERPHKRVLLLSILDLLDRGVIAENRVPLSDELARSFRRHFDVVRERDDQPTQYPRGNRKLRVLPPLSRILVHASAPRTIRFARSPMVF